jgi:hypothetical protein
MVEGKLVLSQSDFHWIWYCTLANQGTLPSVAQVARDILAIPGGQYCCWVPFLKHAAHLDWWLNINDAQEFIHVHCNEWLERAVRQHERGLVEPWTPPTFYRTES